MTDWTKPESYNAKTIAWYEAKERLRDRPADGKWMDGWRNAIRSIPAISSFGAPDSVEPPRVRAEFGNCRSGKTESLRNWAVDLASGPDRSAKAVWINGRLWILD